MNMNGRFAQSFSKHNHPSWRVCIRLQDFQRSAGCSGNDLRAIGIWGLMQIDERRMKALSTMFAGFVGLADYVVEVMIVNSGGYGYFAGFRAETPLIYSMVIMAIFGVIEWSKKRRANTSLLDAVS